MWVRGLKLISIYIIYNIIQVAPYVGAWIETQRPHGTSLKREVSHPMWVRGLKLPNQV